MLCQKIKTLLRSVDIVVIKSKTTCQVSIIFFDRGEQPQAKFLLKKVFSKNIF